MILTIGDWVFDVDLETTMTYSAKASEDHCDCGYCRNFYAAADGQYPQLRPFLAQFGLDIEAPEELMPFDDGTDCIYNAMYIVCGRILQQGSDLKVGEIPVRFTTGYGCNSECPPPCFTLEAGLFSLPWVLEEPMEEVVSPANEPSFLKRMWNKLLGRGEDTLKS